MREFEYISGKLIIHLPKDTKIQINNIKYSDKNEIIYHFISIVYKGSTITEKGLLVITEFEVVKN